MKVEFVDPPDKAPGGKPTVVTSGIRAAVKKRPGQWARIRVAVSSNAATNALGYAKRHPEWEVTSRAVKGQRGRYDVYLRYVGGDT